MCSYKYNATPKQKLISIMQYVPQWEVTSMQTGNCVPRGSWESICKTSLVLYQGETYTCSLIIDDILQSVIDDILIAILQREYLISAVKDLCTYIVNIKPLASYTNVSIIHNAQWKCVQARQFKPNILQYYSVESISDACVRYAPLCHACIV